jgi:hypothetical protein
MPLLEMFSCFMISAYIMTADYLGSEETMDHRGVNLKPQYGARIFFSLFVF